MKTLLAILCVLNAVFAVIMFSIICLGHATGQVWFNLIFNSAMAVLAYHLWEEEA